MIEYRCPACRRLAFKASHRLMARVEVKCHGCASIVQPHAVGPLYAEYVCGRCGRLDVRIAAPDALPSLCVPCGVRMVPAPERVERPAYVAYVSVSISN